MSDIKILLADGHLVVRNGIKLLLNAQPNFTVVADVNDGKEILDLLDTGLEIDVILADFSLQTEDDFILISDAKAKFPKVKVIILSMLDVDHHVARAFEYGAMAYLVKSVTAEELMFCIEHVAQGGRYLCEEVSMRLVEKLLIKSPNRPVFLHPKTIEMSARELEILELLGDGFTNLEIAKKLFLSKRTVEGHRQNLLDKTDSKNTPALIKYAILFGLIR